MLGRLRNDDFSRFRADKHEHVHLPQSTIRDGSHREEVAGPERFTVTFDELGPSVGPAFGSRFDSFFLQDVTDGLAAYLLDAQFSHLAADIEQALPVRGRWKWRSERGRGGKVASFVYRRKSNDDQGLHFHFTPPCDRRDKILAGDLSAWNGNRSEPWRELGIEPV